MSTFGFGEYEDCEWCVVEKKRIGDGGKIELSLCPEHAPEVHD